LAWTLAGESFLRSCSSILLGRLDSLEALLGPFSSSRYMILVLATWVDNGSSKLSYLREYVNWFEILNDLETVVLVFNSSGSAESQCFFQSCNWRRKLHTFVGKITLGSFIFCIIGTYV